jgi:hypothetical protein
VLTMNIVFIILIMNLGYMVFLGMRVKKICLESLGVESS